MPWLMLCQKPEMLCAKICYLLLTPTGPGFGVPPTGPGFGGYPQPPAQSYGGGGPAQIPGMWMFLCHMYDMSRIQG